MSNAVWIPTSRLLASRVPPLVAGWLFDPGSLTQSLINHCLGEFSVRVLEQGHARPRRDECRVLSLTSASYALIREVHLLCRGEPVVYARSVIPHSTLRGPNRRLAYLRDRPLGAYLFAQPTLRRSEMEIAALRPGMSLFEHARQGMSRKADTIWGRRSVFRVHERPLLVAECFLPELFGE